MACCLWNVVFHGEGLYVGRRLNLAVQSLKKSPACMNSKASPYVQKAFIRAYSKLVRS